ncbi:MAG TPA: AtpZ/AtpI family protein [Burkholderiaceae bacterium]|nr:AtpZ/AtpI family protein [Burkholderiaceae bacterium]
MSETEDAGDLAAQVRRRAGRAERWLREGDPTLLRQLAAVGVLGWVVVLPLLAGIAVGHWIDRTWHTGIVFTAALLLVGLSIGCWSAWRWMHGR